jgi:hypothetical protein
MIQKTELLVEHDIFGTPSQVIVGVRCDNVLASQNHVSVILQCFVIEE